MFNLRFINSVSFAAAAKYMAAGLVPKTSKLFPVWTHGNDCVWIVIGEGTAIHSLRRWNAARRPQNAFGLTCQALSGLPARPMYPTSAPRWFTRQGQLWEP